MSPSIIDHRLPYESRLRSRALETIDLVVIHCTELPDLASAREYGEQLLYPSGTGNSGHYYIDRDGHTECYVAPGFIAHHVRGHNEHAIGIELVNRGRYPDWLDSTRQQMDEAYPAAQINALVVLLQELQMSLPALRFIAGHEDLDHEQVAASDDPARQVRRKLDPGPCFPWHDVLQRISLTRFQPPL